MRPELTIGTLKRLLSYDPETGIFSRLTRQQGVSRVGTIAGTPKGNGYRMLSVAGHRCLAHRLAWFYMYGVWPEQHIDHINGCRDDNRIVNLRDVSIQVNMQNTRVPRKNNGCGFLGVSFDKVRGKYQAGITVGWKRFALGRFDTPESAHAAYLAAKRKRHKGGTI